MQRGNVPGDHIFCSRNTDFAEKPMNNSGSGVDMALNWRRPDGILVLSGTAGEVRGAQSGH